MGLAAVHPQSQSNPPLFRGQIRKQIGVALAATILYYAVMVGRKQRERVRARVQPQVRLLRFLPFRYQKLV